MNANPQKLPYPANVRMTIPRICPILQMFECRPPENTPSCKCSNADPRNYPILQMFECRPQKLFYPANVQVPTPETTPSCKCSNVRPHCLPDSRRIQGGRGDQKFLGRLLSDLRRLQLEASSDDRVGDQVVDPAHVDQRDRDDDDPRGRSFD